MKLQTVKSQKLPIQSEQDIVKVRRLVREWAVQANFSLLQQTKLMTATSELARNIFRYAGSGIVQLNLVNNGLRTGLNIVFEDQGPGIADINLAMRDSYSTGGSLGMGLGGTRRLMDQFNITSEVGVGTMVTITLWR